eukprot:9608853-Ditylum_brightwellii.AAC.1
MSSETYKQILHHHKKYVDTVTAVAVEGLHPEVLVKEIEVGEEKHQCITVCYVKCKDRIDGAKKPK